MLMEMISLTSYTGPLHCHACGAEYSTAVRNLTQFKIKNLIGLLLKKPKYCGKCDSLQSLGMAVQDFPVANT